MKVLSLCLLGLLAACEVPKPLNTQVPGPYGWEEASDIAMHEWRDRLKVFLYKEPNTYWFEGECLEYPEDVPGMPAEGCLIGAYLTRPYTAEIHLIYKEFPSDSALAHELLHWAIDVKRLPDGDHTRPEWDQVVEVEEVLYREGL